MEGHTYQLLIFGGRIINFSPLNIASSMFGDNNPSNRVLSFLLGCRRNESMDELIAPISKNADIESAAAEVQVPVLAQVQVQSEKMRDQDEIIQKLLRLFMI